MSKQRLIVSFKKLSPELQSAILQVYPEGFDHVIKKYPKSGNDFFYAFPFETTEISYLVKVDVMVDGELDDKTLDSLLANEPISAVGKEMFDSELPSEEEEETADDKYNDEDEEEDDEED
jgi:hypothetical protein